MFIYVCCSFWKHARVQIMKALQFGQVQCYSRILVKHLSILPIISLPIPSLYLGLRLS